MEQHLELDGHHLIAASVTDGAVLLWECESCGYRAEDAYDYVAVDCQPA